MKKVIIVLLVAVLVAGFAFADGKAGEAKFTGSATISYDYDLDKKDTGIVNAQAMKYNFTFEFNSAAGESKGDGKLYAEIAATAKIELVAKDVAGNVAEMHPKATLKISKANIIAGDLTIDILGPKGLYSFAEFYADDEYDEGEIGQNESIADLGLGNHGLRVLYKDFEVSFAFWHAGETTGDVIAPANTKLYAGLKTPAFKLADGMTLTAGANYFFDKDEDEDALMFIGGGFGFDYAPEDSKLSASLAADVLDIIIDADNSILPIDISANVTYDFVSADVYFFTLDKFDKDGFNLLAAKVSADYDVNDALNVGGYAEIIYEQIFGEDAKPVFRFGASVKYTAEKFTASAGVDACLRPTGDDGAYELKKYPYFDGKTKPGLGLTAEISSKAVIDNATVGIKWTGSDLSEKDGDDNLNQLGKISAYIKVSF